MKPEAISYLSRERPGQFHDRLVTYLTDLANQSRAKMKTYYPQWRNTDESFRAQARVKAANKEEVRDQQKADERSEPGKFVVPIGHSQIDTFVSFGYQTFTQRENIFELEPVGVEDELSAKIAEASLEYDLSRSNFRGPVLIQYLTDIARYSFGVLKYAWVDEKQMFEKSVPAPTSGVDGLAPVVKTQEVPETVFQGNKIVNTSVYRFLPDPRLPIYRFQEGEFCGDEDYTNYHKLKQQEADQTIAGLQYVQKVNTNSLDNGRDFPFDPQQAFVDAGSKNVIDQPYILTEMQVTLCPKNFLSDLSEDNRKDLTAILGDEDRPVKFLFWVLNDNRVVRIERLDYPTGRYTWEVGILYPDAENFLGLSLYDVIGNLQLNADWLINSRITDIRKHINLDMILDTSAVNADDIKQRRSIIRLNKSAQGMDVRRFVFQLQRNDTTQSNIADSEVMHNYAKEGTGLTDNLVGQFAQGRRSAREASQVYSNASNRIKTAFSCVWFTGLKPLGEALLANQRAGLDIERLVKIQGIPDVNDPQSALVGMMLYKQVTPEVLAGNYDFKIFDGTMASERQQQAATLQEFLTAGMQNPQIFLVAQLNPAPMILDLFELRGIRNVTKYRLPPDQVVRMAQLLGLTANAGTPPVNGGPQAAGGQQPAQQPGYSNGTSAPSGSRNGQGYPIAQR